MKTNDRPAFFRSVNGNSTNHRDKLPLLYKDFNPKTPLPREKMFQLIKGIVFHTFCHSCKAKISHHIQGNDKRLKSDISHQKHCISTALLLMPFFDLLKQNSSYSLQHWIT